MVGLFNIMNNKFEVKILIIFFTMSSYANAQLSLWEKEVNKVQIKLEWTGDQDKPPPQWVITSRADAPVKEGWTHLLLTEREIKQILFVFSGKYQEVILQQNPPSYVLTVVVSLDKEKEKRFHYLLDNKVSLQVLEKVLTIKEKENIIQTISKHIKQKHKDRQNMKKIYR